MASPMPKRTPVSPSSSLAHSSMGESLSVNARSPRAKAYFSPPAITSKAASGSFGASPAGGGAGKMPRQARSTFRSKAAHSFSYSGRQARQWAYSPPSGKGILRWRVCMLLAKR